jgi:hypothetical protein
LPIFFSWLLSRLSSLGLSQVNKPIRYEVTNKVTGKTKRYKTSAGASRAMDKADNAYGAYITTRKAIYA